MSEQLGFSPNESDESCFEEVLNTYETFTKTSEIPVDIFKRFVVSLCRVVNIESYSQKAWSIVRDVAQSNQSLILISHLISILNDSNYWHHPIILRGSVFFLGMSLWGYHRIDTLDIPYNVILTYFYNVLSCKHGLVVNEVLKTIRRLISKFGNVLKVEYQIISKILSKSRQILEIHADETILSTLMDIIRSIQKQKKTNKFLRDYDIGLNTIVPLTSLLDEDIIINYLEEIETSLTILDASWKSTLEIFLKSFFVRDSRTNIRKKVLEIVKKFYESNVDISGDDILQVSIPIMKHAFDDMDDTIIEMYLDLYFNMCQNVSNQKFLVLIENVYQLLYSPNTSTLTKRRIAVHFNRLFVNKLPSTNVSQVIEIFKKLIKFISYDDQFIRAETIKTLSDLSGTHKYTIKYKDIHCPHIKFYSKSSTNKNQKLLPVHELIEEFRNRIKKEESRDIFYLLIQGILGFFYNGWILVQADIGSLTTLICRLLENKLFGFFLNQKELDINKDITNGYRILLSSLCYLLPKESEISELLINTFATSITEGFCKNYCDDNTIHLCLSGLIQCSLYRVNLFSKILPDVLDSIEKLCSKIDTFTESKIYLIDFIYFLSLRNEFAKIGIDHAGKLIQILLGFFKNNGNPDKIVLQYAFQALISWFNQFDNQTRLNYFEPVRKKIKKLKNKENTSLVESYMDLLTKIVFIDCNPMVMNEETFLFKENDDIKISGWIKGNSLLIIKTNKMGWSQVTVRRPSGKYTWMMQIQNKLRNIKSSVTSIVEIPPSYFDFLNEGIFESANDMSKEIEELKFRLRESMSFDSPRIKRITEDVSPTEEHPSIFLDLGDMVYSDDLFDVPLSPKNQRATVKEDVGYVSSVSSSSYSQLPSYEESHQQEDEEEENTEDNLNNLNEEQINTIKVDHSSDSIKIRIMKDSEDNKQPISRSLEKSQLGRSKSDENILTQEIKDSKKNEMPFSEKFKKQTRVRPSKRSSSFSKRLSTDINLFESFEEIKKSIRKSKLTHEKEIKNNKTIDRQSLTEKPYPLIKKRSEESLAKRIPDRRFSVDQYSSKNIRDSREFENKQTLVHPSFIFLQFQQLPNIKSYSDRLHISKQLEEALKTIDEILPFETFAVNVLYVGYEQRNSEEILSNSFGSLEYENFISGLGNFKRLKDCKYYTGGLDTLSDADGKYFVLYTDKLRQIAFHISTMLPNRQNQSDSNVDVNYKINIMKNNFVTIVWNEYSNEEYDISQLKELHEFITIIITPLVKRLYKIKIESKINFPFLGTMLETQVIAEEILCDLIRLTTINAYFIVQRYLFAQGKHNIVSNFEKRLHFVQSFREKFHVGNSIKSPRKK